MLFTWTWQLISGHTTEKKWLSYAVSYLLIEPCAVVGPHKHLPIHNRMLTSSILHRYWASSHSYCELTGTITKLDKQKNVTQHSSPSSKSYILFILSSAVFTVYLVPFRTEYLTNCGIYQMPWLQVGAAGKLSLEPLKLFNIFYFIRILFSLLIPSPYLSLCMDICVYLCI